MKMLSLRHTKLLIASVEERKGYNEGALMDEEEGEKEKRGGRKNAVWHGMQRSIYLLKAFLRIRIHSVKGIPAVTI